MNTSLDTECSPPASILSKLTFLSISEFTVSAFRFQNIESFPTVSTGFYLFRAFCYGKLKFVDAESAAQTLTADTDMENPEPWTLIR